MYISVRLLVQVHRIGQTRTVHIQRLVIANTVEDRVLALQERKVRSGISAFINILPDIPIRSKTLPTAVSGKVTARK
jgi:hypothetical protein